MTDPQPDSQDNLPPEADQDVERLRRLAQAVEAGDPQDLQACRRVQQMLPRLAEAELRGVRIRRQFPVETAHMDACEDCAMAYAELLDALIGLEEIVGQQQASQPPPLPARLTLVMRLRGWVVRVSQNMATVLKLADPANFEAAAQALLERLPELPQPFTPRQAEQLALGWGADTDAARLMLACWDTTEQIVGRYPASQLEDLAAAGRLPEVARLAAQETARRLKLGKLSSRYVELYVADVAANPSSLAALAQRPS